MTTNQSPSNKQSASETSKRWSLIPALTFAGLLSAIWTEGYIWFPTEVWVQSGTLFVLLGSALFGLSLGAVLWLYRLLRTWKALATAVGATVAAHFLAEIGVKYTGIRLRDDVDVPVLGSFTPEIVLTTSAVASILIFTLLKLAGAKCKIRRLLLLTIGCSLLAGITVGLIDGTQSGAWVSLLKGNFLGWLWQIALAFFVSIALVLGHVDFSFAQQRDSEGYILASILRRFSASGVLLVFLVVTSSWCHSAQVRYGKRNLELQARTKAAIANSLAEAPSFQGLSTPELKSLGQVLFRQEINGWKPYLSGSQTYPAEKKVGDTNAPFPERRTYSARYAIPDNNYWTVVANVTEYPNAEWAKYATRNTPMVHEFIKHPESIKRLSRFGNDFYQDGPNFFWPSDNELLFLEFSGVSSDVIDEFLKVYLVKYPSSL